MGVEFNDYLQENDKKKELEYVNHITENNLIANESLIEGSSIFSLPHKNTGSPLWRQTLACFGPLLVTTTSGLTNGYSAILVAQLLSAGYVVDTSTTSWIASITILPMAFGCLLTSWLIDKFGRRLSLLIITLANLTGWIIIVYADNVFTIAVGRFVVGFCVGLQSAAVSVYIAEVTDPKYRGLFLSVQPFSVALGILIAHAVGIFMHWKIASLICSLFPLVSYVFILYQPESPYYTIRNGFNKQGIDDFIQLRGIQEIAVMELKSLLKNQEQEKVPETLVETLKDIKNPEIWKPLLISNAFLTLSQLSGTNAVVFYTITIAENTMGKKFDKIAATLIIDVTRTLVTILSCIAIRKFKRRVLTIVSGIFTALSLFALSVFLYYSRSESSMPWFPLACFIAYICAISFGITPLPWIMLAEMYPLRFRGLGSAFTSSIGYGSIFLVVKTAPSMMSAWGEAGTFLFYGIVATINTILMYFILPETKGKTLQQVECAFKHTKL